MRMINNTSNTQTRVFVFAASLGLVLAACAVAQTDETEKREAIAAANMQDAVVVDCQLPGKLRKLGGTRTYLTPGRLIRTPAVTCRSRGGEYTLGDLASGTLSLQRWMIPAEEGDPEAQYYVARIHANGMDDVAVDYSKAAVWYEKASAQGYSEAKQELGYLYEQGLGVDQDPLKALNLQRDASGLGDDLDYAYKIDEAEKLASDLIEKLAATNEVLRDSQLQAQQTEDRLARARSEIRRHELETTALVAELNTALANSGNANSPRAEELEQQLENTKDTLRVSQASVIALEKERDAANAKLALQILGGQAVQLELRELLARTESAEQQTESLAAQLVESQQRLIQADEELRAMRISYQNQTERLTAETARYSEAKARSNSDAEAFIAAKEVEIASKTARVESLQSQVQTLQAELKRARDNTTEAALKREISDLQQQHKSEITGLQNERKQLEANSARNEQELSAMYAESQHRLSKMAAELRSRKLRIDTLSAESESLRAQVGELKSKQFQLAETSGKETTRIKAQLSKSREEAAALRNAVAQIRSDKMTLEAQLAKNRADLQEKVSAGNLESEEEIKLLNAQIAADKSTINAQNLRIASLRDQVSDLDALVANLKTEIGDPEPIPVEVQNAMVVLELARSRDEPNLGEYHALLIANEKYENLDTLETPIKDAKEIGNLLTSKYGFKVELLVNATDDQIMRKLHAYSNTLTSRDNLLIYYAGRGSTPDGPPDRAYWLGVDADPEVGTGLLLAEHVSEKIKNIDAQRILVVTDSCFSKRRLRKNTLSVGRGLDPKRFKLLAKFRSRNVLTSGANLPIYDDKGDRTHSLFAKFFLEILRRNENVLSGEMLYFEMAQRIREQLEEPGKATPTYNSLQGAGHKAGDFFFVPELVPTMIADASLDDNTA